jgi:hypothetical protein
MKEKPPQHRGIGLNADAENNHIAKDDCAVAGHEGHVKIDASAGPYRGNTPFSSLSLERRLD